MYPNFGVSTDFRSKKVSNRFLSYPPLCNIFDTNFLILLYSLVLLNKYILYIN